MPHRIGMSGSVILSDENRFNDLFWDAVDYIEIGEFDDSDAFELFLEWCRRKEKPFGIHLPLYRNESKNDLLERVQFDPECAWEQLERDAHHLAHIGADYVLVHFPYLKASADDKADERMEQALIRLAHIQRKCGLPLICEPKLGLNRSAAAIEVLHHFSTKTWEKYGLKLCVDIGDYMIATEDRIVEYVHKWHDYIRVVHVHNVYFTDAGKYIWVPAHPAYESNDAYYTIEPVIRELAKNDHVHFVFEHTPHTNPADEFVREGIQWIRSIIEKG